MTIQQWNCLAARIRAVLVGWCGSVQTRPSGKALAFAGIWVALGMSPYSAAQEVVSISDTQSLEGMNLVFHISATPQQETEFTWTVEGGNAAPEDDFSAPSEELERTITIPQGQSDAQILIPTTEDVQEESDETVVIVLTGKTGWTQVAIGTIVDDDAALALTWNSPLVIAEAAWTVFLFLLVILAKCRIRYGIASPVELRGLNLPRGSVRAILALFAVGSFVIVIVFGGPTMGEYYDVVLAAFGSLTGSIIGFYFGNRGASTTPTRQHSDEIQKLIEEAGERFGDEGAQAVAVWIRLNPGGDREIVRRAADSAIDVDEFKQTLGVD